MPSVRCEAGKRRCVSMQTESYHTSHQQIPCQKNEVSKPREETGTGKRMKRCLLPCTRFPLSLFNLFGS